MMKARISNEPEFMISHVISAHKYPAQISLKVISRSTV
jgi:hypothetical protein